MQKIFDNLFLIENEKGANVYLIDNGDSFDLIDSAMFKETDKLIANIEHDGFHIRKLRTVILTHCHCDHIGGAAELVRYTGAKLAAHTEDIPYMLHEKVISGSYHNMMVQEQAFMKQLNCVIQKVDIPLSDNDIIDTLGIGTYLVRLFCRKKIRHYWRKWKWENHTSQTVSQTDGS